MMYLPILIRERGWKAALFRRAGILLRSRKLWRRGMRYPAWSTAKDRFDKNIRSYVRMLASAGYLERATTPARPAPAPGQPAPKETSDE